MADGGGEGGSCWDRLGVYDSDDLMPDAVFLLAQRGAGKGAPTRAFLWLGGSAAADVAAAVASGEAATKALAFLGGSGGVAVENDGAESDAFWDLFEAGY